MNKKYHAFLAFVACATVACGTEAKAALITGETATATSTAVPTRAAIKAVNDSGIIVSGGGSLSVNGELTHDNVASNMWMAGIPSNSGAALGHSITIDLSGGNNALPHYNLDGMRIWNYNEISGGNDTGVRVYDLETSPNGSSWTLQQNDQTLAQPTANVPTVGVYTPINWTDVRFVRITIVDTYRGNDDAAGLSEVMFSGTAVPEPGSLVMFGIGALGFVAIRRHSCMSKKSA